MELHPDSWPYKMAALGHLKLSKLISMSKTNVLSCPLSFYSGSDIVAAGASSL